MISCFAGVWVGLVGSYRWSLMMRSPWATSEDLTPECPGRFPIRAPAAPLVWVAYQRSAVAEPHLFEHQSQLMLLFRPPQFPHMIDSQQQSHNLSDAMQF
ncbi:hypothetical protein B0T16DRAFT_116003 [Cercophora newfieldiana]|uniref:Uncharacterized protein n=1 Tax=Cercophora newfieldiana TaxID=92897 RepID=A0AA39YCF4_9PEZI|nr:hypothetical protein B0T16DRAFT_116003 [Cercophora newfieldiana]